MNQRRCYIARKFRPKTSLNLLRYAECFTQNAFLVGAIEPKFDFLIGKHGRLE